MSENSKIEWTDHTFNPWEGCQKVSPGCDHCYAETRNARFAGGTAINWGPGAPRRRTSPANWRKPLQWNKAHAEFFAQHGRRQRVFCASLADVFDNDVNRVWRGDLFRLIEQTPNLDWLLLTKRIGNAMRLLPSHDWCMGRDNVWLGATVVNQEEALRDVPKLMQVPARRRFLSVEPMLGPIDLTEVNYTHSPGYFGDAFQWHHLPYCNRHETYPSIDWVIVGGESGPDARPMHPQWARELRDQCAEASVPFLFKQWGEWKPISEIAEADMNALYRPNRVAGEFEDQGVLNELHGRTCKVAEDAIGYGGARGFDKAFRVVEDRNGRQRGGMHMFKLGKKLAGRELDCRTHDEFPRGAQ